MPVLARMLSPTVGVNFSLPPIALNQRASTKGKNVRYFRGGLRKRPGLSTFAGTTTDNHVSYFTAKFTTGTVEVLLATLDDLFRISGGAWSSLGTNIFTGTSSDFFAGATVLDKFYISNGIDDLLSWNGTDASTSAVTGAPAAAAMDGFADRLILGNVMVSGTHIPQRVRWPVSGNADDWTGIGSGATDLVATPGFIRHIKQLRGQLLIYKDDSIVSCQRTGVATEPFIFDERASAIGVVGSRAVYSIRNRHYFVGDDLNIYQHEGVEPAAIGDDIVRDLQSQVDTNTKDFTVVRANPLRNEVYVGIRRSGSDNINFFYVYNWAEESNPWSTWEGITTDAFDVVERSTARTWDDFGGPWDSSSEPWDSSLNAAKAPLVLSGLATQARELDEDRTSDLGSTAIDFDWRSFDSDAELPGMNKTVLRVTVRYRNLGSTTTLTVGVSTDGGQVFTTDDVTLGTTSSTDDILKAYAYFIVTGETLRIQLRDNTNNSQLQIHEVIVEGEESGAAF